ncbi:MAG: pilus assembly PilX family protein [Gemmatimonadota bacterium]
MRGHKGQRPRRRVGREGGFALTVVLFGMVALGLASVAGYYVVRTESRLAANERDATRALFVAQSGLERFVGEHQGALPPAATTYSVQGGTATVTLRKVVNLEFPNELYLITSAGTVPDPRFPNLPARRAVQQFAVYRRAAMNVAGAITAPHGIHKNGAAGVISGNDAATTSTSCPDGPQPSVAGVVVPEGGYSQSGGAPVPQGTPGIREETDSLAVAKLVDVPWSDLTSGGVPTDYVLPPQTWPNFGSLPGDAYPTILVDGDIILGPSEAGRGTLIVTGSVTMSGAFAWDGIILVGKRMKSNGNNTVYGAVATGLNVLLGQTVAGVDSVYPSDLGNGTKVFQYNSCNVLKAGKKLAYLRVLPNTWWERF